MFIEACYPGGKECAERLVAVPPMPGVGSSGQPVIPWASARGVRTSTLAECKRTVLRRRRACWGDMGRLTEQFQRTLHITPPPFRLKRVFRQGTHAWNTIKQT